MNVKVHVLSVADGDIVAKDIFNSHGLLVISAGTKLKEKDIALLLRHHLDFIDIEERQAESMTTLPQLVSSSGTDRLQSSYKERSPEWSSYSMRRLPMVIYKMNRWNRH